MFLIYVGYWLLAAGCFLPILPIGLDFLLNSIVVYPKVNIWNVVYWLVLWDSSWWSVEDAKVEFRNDGIRWRCNAFPISIEWLFYRVGSVLWWFSGCHLRQLVSRLYGVMWHELVYFWGLCLSVWWARAALSSWHTKPAISYFTADDAGDARQRGFSKLPASSSIPAIWQPISHHPDAQTKQKTSADPQIGNAVISVKIGEMSPLKHSSRAASSFVYANKALLLNRFVGLNETLICIPTTIAIIQRPMVLCADALLYVVYQIGWLVNLLQAKRFQSFGTFPLDGNSIFLFPNQFNLSPSSHYFTSSIGLKSFIVFKKKTSSNELLHYSKHWWLNWHSIINAGLQSLRLVLHITFT